MADIKPYTISIEPSRIDDLKKRLSLASFPDELDDAGWDMGVPLSDVKRLTAYWETEFDWKKVEAELNQLPQFVTEIQCDGFDPLSIHFVYKKSKVKGAIPLIFIHGWPGNYLEGTKILKELVDDGDGVNTPAFDMVIPSLPNYAWSQGPKKRGFALEQYAETMNKLMLKLGYNEYVTQGGDWGTHISRTLAHMYPKHCRATHLNYDMAFPPSFFKQPLLALEHALRPYNKREKFGVERSAWFDQTGRGYSTEQSTKPQTLGYALADSPVALLSWVYEKLHDWSDSYPWTDEEILTWISIYWFSTAGPAANIRIYYETKNNVDGRPNKMNHDRLRSWSPGVKLGFSHFPMDLQVRPSTWVRTLGNVVFENEHEDGGHYAGWERPQQLLRDLRTMYGKGGGAAAVVKGHTGYTS